jgi:hypothetical protein
LIKSMMNSKPAARVKLPQIKSHPWFALYKVSFEEAPVGTQVRKSNLITDSMILEGEDPFDDFMNKRLNYSSSSGGKSPDESFKSGRNLSDFGRISDIEGNPPHMSFKKQDRLSDLSLEMGSDEILGLEIIPEERGVISCYLVNWRH